jgi:hypothetical protein
MWFNPAEITKIAKPPNATLATIATYPAKGNAECPKVAEVAKVATPHELKNAPLHDLDREWIDEPWAIALAETIAETMPTVKAADLIYTLQLGGFVFSLVDDGLRVEPFGKLTLATKNLISENEAAVIAELRQQAGQDVPQRICVVPVAPTTPAALWDALLAQTAPPADAAGIDCAARVAT